MEKGGVYEVDCESYEEVRNDAPAKTPEEADGVTHGWWWEEWEEVVAELRRRDVHWLDRVEGLVAK